MRTISFEFMTRLIGALLVVMMLAAIPAAGQTKVGTTAGQFLGISVGPRAMAMGGAYVASNEDVTSIYWNPGAFQQAGKSQLAFSNTDWLVGTKFRWVGLMLNIGSENAIGVSLTQLDYGEEEVTTVALPEGTGERWSAQDLSIGLSYCRRLTDRFSVGATVKYVDQRIWNESATAFAFDIGLLFVTGFQDMRLGVSMSNFGGEMKMDGRDLLQRVDIDPQNSGSNKALVGTLKEVGWNNMVFLRGGYKSLFGKDAEEGLSLGAGLKYTAEGFGAIEVNYAYTKFGLFGNLNTIALAVSF